MALAVWEFDEDGDLPFEEPSGGLRLRLLTDRDEARFEGLEEERLAAGTCRRHGDRAVPGRRGRPRAGTVVDVPGLRTDSETVRRDRQRRSRRQRRARTLAVAFVLVVVVLLALPLRLFGASSTGPSALSGSTPGRPSVYVVRPGDTLWSIATRLDPAGDPRPIVARLSQEAGSTTVVPGEHLVLPG